MVFFTFIIILIIITISIFVLAKYIKKNLLKNNNTLYKFGFNSLSYIIIAKILKKPIIKIKFFDLIDKIWINYMSFLILLFVNININIKTKL